MKVCVPTHRVIEIDEGKPKIEVIAMLYDNVYYYVHNVLVKFQNFFVITLRAIYEDMKLLEHIIEFVASSLKNHYDLCRRKKYMKKLRKTVYKNMKNKLPKYSYIPITNIRKMAYSASRC